MPVTTTRPPTADQSGYAGLRSELADELRTPKEFGQPTINEEPLPRSSHFGVVVFWDRWVGVADEDRPAVITRAYQEALPHRVGQLAFAVGYTVPEAIATGLLRFSVEAVVPADRSDLIWPCAQAMLNLGGSILRRGPRQPELWCQTREEAERYRDKLRVSVAGADMFWVIYDALNRVTC